ncbi:MAG: HNH endonuclease [Firmicutes bacterium]|nr:HNH endonuclease [Bacillota bacterium]
MIKITGIYLKNELRKNIKPYSQNGLREIRNGLLLREDLHTLFDQGYPTVTKDYRMEVSRLCKQMK